MTSLSFQTRRLSRRCAMDRSRVKGTCKQAACTINADVDNADTEANDDDDDDDSPDIGDLFADPDPLGTFHFEYTLPPVILKLSMRMRMMLRLRLSL
jgi:hypothetical protein